MSCRDKDPGGFLATVAIGIVGALIGGFLGRLVGLYGQDDPVGFFMAVIGAVVLLWLYRVVTHRTNAA